MKKELLSYIRRRLWIIILLTASLIIYRLAFLFPDVTESVYSRTIYPFFANIWSFLTGLIPFSLGEIGLYAFFAALVFYFFYIFSSFFIRGKRWLLFFKRLISLICVIALLGSCFILNWAINYARLPLSTTMGISTEKYSAQELFEVSMLLADRANELRGKVKEDENGVFVLSSSKDEILREVGGVYKSCAPDYLKRVSSNAPAKGVLTKNLLSTFETTGIFSPFTYEANLNMQMPESYFPSTVAHEYAHLQGYAREDEANFISWYVARKSDNTDFAYSAYLLALTYSINSLYSSSNELYKQLYENISDGVLRDLRDNSAYWKDFDTQLSEKANDVYSSYLKSSGVSDGNKSYGRMLDLILALYKSGETI